MGYTPNIHFLGGHCIRILQSQESRFFVKKVLNILFSTLCAIGELQAQSTFSLSEALKQLYRGYDPDKQTAQWVCTKEQERKGAHAGWPCSKEYPTASVSVLLEAEVQEGDAKRLYLVTSAKPLKDAFGEYECHGCLPAVGMAMFSNQGQAWILESANAVVGFYGCWGHPPGVDLVEVGPQKHGIILSTADVAQGFAWSSKSLLAPFGRTIVEAWRIQDENDNIGSIDPDDKQNKGVPYRASATFKFLAGDGVIDGTGEYYDLEVTSHGKDREDYVHPIKAANWTEIYRFRDGKYRLIHHEDFIMVKKPR